MGGHGGCGLAPRGLGHVLIKEAGTYYISQGVGRTVGSDFCATIVWVTSSSPSDATRRVAHISGGAGEVWGDVCVCVCFPSTDG